MLKDTVQLIQIHITSHLIAQSVFQPWKDFNIQLEKLTLVHFDMHHFIFIVFLLNLFE